MLARDKLTGLKNDGEGGGAWCEIAARVRCEISADQTERKGKRARFNMWFTPGAGFNGKGGLGPLFGWRLTGTFRANRGKS